MVVGLDTGDGPGGRIDALVGEGGEGRGHLLGGHAVGEAAHGQGADGVVPLVQVEAQVVLHEIEGLGGAQHLQDPGGYRVVGLLHGVLHGDRAAKARAGVFGIAAGPGVVDADGVVVDDGGGGDDVRVDGRGVDAHRLDGAAAGPPGGGQVQRPVGGLLPHASGHGHHVAGVGVQDGDGGIQ